MQRARDELARTVLALESRVLDAEDEVSTLKRELQAARESRPTLATPVVPRTPTPPPKETPPPASQKEEQELRSDLEVLLKELDKERKATAELAAVVITAQNEADKATEKFIAAEKKIRELKRSRGFLRSGPDAEASLEQLHERISSLKNARDRLIEALDTQAAESERMAAENASLTTAIEEAREVSRKWETQAQEALLQSNHLKDMLEESAQWTLGGVQIEEQSVEAKCQNVERELLAQQARCASLEVQVRALCAELTRVVTDSAGLHRAAHPMLSGVETRLTALLRNKTRLQSTS